MITLGDGGLFLVASGSVAEKSMFLTSMHQMGRWLPQSV